MIVAIAKVRVIAIVQIIAHLMITNVIVTMIACNFFYGNTTISLQEWPIDVSAVHAKKRTQEGGQLMLFRDLLKYSSW